MQSQFYVEQNDKTADDLWQLPRLSASYQREAWVDDHATPFGEPEEFDASQIFLSLGIDEAHAVLASVEAGSVAALDVLAVKSGLADRPGHDGPFTVRIDADELSDFLAALRLDGEFDASRLAQTSFVYAELKELHSEIDTGRAVDASQLSASLSRSACICETDQDNDQEKWFQMAVVDGLFIRLCGNAALCGDAERAYLFSAREAKPMLEGLLDDDQFEALFSDTAPGGSTTAPRM
ncbi:hypothetical protein [Thalassospira xiamenensis]|uniref:Uncharacterized protein n=1 Tax=Thalassospira xiamenensis TaxID=220697 RepID=A0A285THZ0_9PROT|nr:hypothetical protein [Thalassospira xiamenensis]SOC21587.1 hypothetical protein SAMN05428964_103447 [Thalassospira xiamenensis]